MRQIIKCLNTFSNLEWVHQGRNHLTMKAPAPGSGASQRPGAHARVCVQKKSFLRRRWTPCPTAPAQQHLQRPHFHQKPRNTATDRAPLTGVAPIHMQCKDGWCWAHRCFAATRGPGGRLGAIEGKGAKSRQFGNGQKMDLTGAPARCRPLAPRFIPRTKRTARGYPRRRPLDAREEACKVRSFEYLQGAGFGSAENDHQKWPHRPCRAATLPHRMDPSEDTECGRGIPPANVPPQAALGREMSL
jgi:hypothetical protein